MTTIEIQITAAPKPIVPVLAGLLNAIIKKIGMAKWHSSAAKTTTRPGTQLSLRQRHDQNLSTVARIDPASLTTLM